MNPTENRDYSMSNLDLVHERRRIRNLGKSARRAIDDRAIRSQAISQRLQSLEEYRQASSVLFYVHLHDEVQTIDSIACALDQQKAVSVPYCFENRLRLFALQKLEELEPGAFGILEPPPALRRLPSKQVDVRSVDLVIVPGVAFDLHGGRLGYGKGFYDRLLADAPKGTKKIGLAFDSQIFEHIPMESHDIPMDIVITETATHLAKPTHNRTTH